MNLLLLRPSDVIVDGITTLTDYRAEHMLSVLKVSAGSNIQVGKLDAAIGTATVITTSHNSVTLRLAALDKAPPPTLPCDVLLALPRPRMLHRSLQTLATMGVQHIHLIQTERVEKSFWQTPLLKTTAVEENLLLGLEQAKATQMPKVSFYKRWPDVKSLIVDLKHQQKVIAHPGPYPQATTLANEPTALAIGPEGGFTEREIAFFQEQGFSGVSLGHRILRVETAVPVLLAKLFDLP